MFKNEKRNGQIHDRGTAFKLKTPYILIPKDTIISNISILLIFKLIK